MVACQGSDQSLEIADLLQARTELRSNSVALVDKCELSVGNNLVGEHQCARIAFAILGDAASNWQGLGLTQVLAAFSYLKK